MIDDLDDDRIAIADGVLLMAGTAVLIGSDLTGTVPYGDMLGGTLIGLGIPVFESNILLVIFWHSLFTFDQVILGRSIHADPRPLISPHRTCERRDSMIFFSN